MYENFTDRARKVLQLANQEARRSNQHFVGTEHLMIALAQEGAGIAANVMKYSFGLDLKSVKDAIQDMFPSTSPETITASKLPQSPMLKKVIEEAINAARQIGDKHVGTEHLLLGLIEVKEGVAFDVLKNRGVTAEAIKDEILRLLGKDEKDKKQAYENLMVHLDWVIGKQTNRENPNETVLRVIVEDDLRYLKKLIQELWDD